MLRAAWEDGDRTTSQRAAVHESLNDAKMPQGVSSQLISPALSRCRGSEIPVPFLFLPRAYETQLAVLLGMFSCCSWHADESLSYASVWGRLS